MGIARLQALKDMSPKEAFFILHEKEILNILGGDKHDFRKYNGGLYNKKLS